MGTAGTGDIAVIGMAGFFPDAPDLAAYWQNILKGHIAIREVPPQRWDWRLYYDPDQRRTDKINSRWGAFLPEIPIDPLFFGIPPKSLAAIETAQLLTLESTRLALADAGYQKRDFDRSRTAVFIGTGAGEGDLGQQYSFRAMLPHFFGESAASILSGLDGQVPDWNGDVFTGIIMNITAGRVADRFNLGGANVTIDAACASALAALRAGILELKAGECDMVIAGGADTLMSPYAYTCFSKVGALSASGRSCPFDVGADGIVLGEGIGTVILKRLADAEKDGDRIDAVIKGMGASSDGKGRGLTVPKPEGQAAALSRAYANAGVDPESVTLIEAHGTGTAAGDSAEAAALNRFFAQTRMPAKTCAVGSVKSMIGHTKCAAGIASLIKTVLAVKHRVLPPTAGVEKPLADLNGSESPLYINTELRPWLKSDENPRRAGVSAFGFGGSNFHVVLEEYPGISAAGRPKASDQQPAEPAADADMAQETELVIFSAEAIPALEAPLHLIETRLAAEPSPALKDLAYTQACAVHDKRPARLAILASDAADLKEKLKSAKTLVKEGSETASGSAGIWLGQTDPASRGKIAFVYPGQGSQYTGMLKALCLGFSRVRSVFERFDRYLSEVLPEGLSRLMMPPASFSSEEKKEAEALLTRSNVAQAAMGAADTAMHELLAHLGVAPDMTAGHSYGEYAALFAAGVLDEAALATISEARGRYILEAAGAEPGCMAAVKAAETDIAPILADMDQVWIANLNSPVQTVISGSRAGVAAAVEEIKKAGFASRLIPVSCAFHSPIVCGAQSMLAECFSGFDFHPPQMPVFSNTTAGRFPDAPDKIRELLIAQLVRPVRFVDQIRKMYAEGARIFVEVGAGDVLTRLISGTLEGKPHQAICCNKKGASGITQLQRALAELFTAGVDFAHKRLYAERSCQALDLEKAQASPAPHSKTAWIIGHGRVRPCGQNLPEPAAPRPIRFSDHFLPENDSDPLAGEAICFSPGQTVENASSTSQQQFDGDLMGQSSNPSDPARTGNPGPAGGSTDETILLKFQELMGQFLETQKAVMTAWLNGGASAPAPPAAHPEEVLRRSTAYAPPDQAPQTGPAPEPELEPELDPEFDPELDQTPKSATNENSLTIEQLLLSIVSEATGYPMDMLELDQEIEADLGIDSIKRMQAMEALQQALEKDGCRLPDTEWEALVESRTLADIAAKLQSAVSRAEASSDDPGEKNAPASASLQARAAASENMDAAGTLIGIVSELSGYPPDMLEPDLEIEADLGIDSIKRMQILEQLEAALDGHGVPLTETDTQNLAESATLGDIISKLEAIAKNSGSRATGSPQSLTAPESESEPEPEPAPAATAVQMDAKDRSGFRESLARRLYQIVEARTGFPAEILAPDLDLRADLDMDEDLGAEIISELVSAWGLNPKAAVPAASADAPAPQCLGDLLDRAAHALKETDSPQPEGGTETDITDSRIKRFTLKLKDQPLMASPAPDVPERPVLLTRLFDDALSKAVRERLESIRCRVVVLEHQALPTEAGPQKAEKSREGVYAADLTSIAALDKVLDQIRTTEGSMAGLLHLAAYPGTRDFASLSLDQWRGQLAVTVKSLFYLTQLLSEDLAAAARKGHSGVLAATAMGGGFASVSPPSGKPGFFPGGASVSGFLKALAEEMPEQNIRAVDFDPDEAPDTAAAAIVDEFTTPSAAVEAGYADGRRVCLDLCESPLVPQHPARIDITADSVLLVTGGARGITAAVSLALARRFQSTLLLVGRTPLEEGEAAEDPETAGITDEKKLKAILSDRLRSEGKKLRPLDVENAYKRLSARREIRETLDRIRETGAKAAYFQADVTDAEGFSRLIESIYSDYGRIDGVVHGAGRIADKRVKDKSADAFDQVFDTKADSLFILSRALRPESLQFLALFSSAAGRFGNAGQADYGAANEVYNKTAQYLNRIWPGRVIAFIWGPWESRGMVSGALQEKFNASGIYLIPRDVGAGHFITELLNGSSADAEVVYGGWDETKGSCLSAELQPLLEQKQLN